MRLPRLCVATAALGAYLLAASPSIAQPAPFNYGPGALPPVLHHHSIAMVFDGGGGPLTGGSYKTLQISNACLIVGAYLVPTPATSVNLAVDLWVAPYSDTSQPTSSNSIVASAPPTLTSSGNLDYRDVTLTGWTKALAAGSTIAFAIKASPTPTSTGATLTLDCVDVQ